MSDSAESRERASKMMLLLAFFGICIISLTSACGSSLANPIRSSESEKNQCLTDLECDEGSFCHSKYTTNQCIPCTDCGKWQQAFPAGKICAQTRAECGACLPGFEDDGSGRCLEKKAELVMFNNSTKNEESSTSSPTLTMICLGVLATATIFGVVGIFGYRRRNKTSTSVDQELMPTAPTEYSTEYSQPPENPGFRTNTIETYRQQLSRSPSGYKLLDERQKATPFTAGTSYGEETLEFFESNPEQQQVPNNDQIIIMNNWQQEEEDQVVAVAAAAPFIPPIPPLSQEMEVDPWEELHNLEDSAFVDIPEGHLNEESINLEDADRGGDVHVRARTPTPPPNPHPLEQQGNLLEEEGEEGNGGIFFEFQARFSLFIRTPRSYSDLHLDLDLPVNDSGFSSSTSNINSPRPSITDHSELISAAADRLPPILSLDGSITTPTPTTVITATTPTPTPASTDHCVPETTTSQVVPPSRFLEQPRGQLNFISSTSRNIQRSRLHGRMRRLDTVQNFSENEDRMEL